MDVIPLSPYGLSRLRRLIASRIDRAYRRKMVSDWPDCIVPGCQLKCCLALNSDKCFPHTTGNEHVKRWKIDARNAEPPKPPTVTYFNGGRGIMVSGGEFRWSGADPEKW